jgi:GLPGLI family protein
MSKFSITTFTSILYSQTSSGIIEYGKKSRPIALTKAISKRKSENLEKFERFQKRREIVANEEKKITFELIFKNEKASFEIKPILKSEMSKNSSFRFGVYDLGNYFTNSNLNLLQFNAFGVFFLITKPELKWVIEKEKKKVGEYNCLKATTEIIVNSKGKKRVITAWFTPKIPIAFGPLGYSGLPGLILELEVHKKIYYVKKITLNPRKEIVVKKPVKGVLVIEKEYHDIASDTTKKLKKNKGF